MVSIREHISLLPYNTFRIEAFARYFAEVESVSDAIELFQSDIFQNNPVLILGGGSNILLTGDFEGLVMKNRLRGIHVVNEDSDRITLTVAGGENWHEFVLYCVDRDFGGIENLSLIPGTVGAAPMQNIGAYGVEIREVVEHVEAVEIATGRRRTFSNHECHFGYRESIFKQELKGKYFISSITLSLTRRNHRFNISYGAIADYLKSAGSSQDLSVRRISDAVIAIRRSKLPDPADIGNAGSFFKNPSVTADKYQMLKKEFPTMPTFPSENHQFKIPAAWLIEQCGWKGKTFGAIGVHKHQALVLVNYGGGEGRYIWDLAMRIQQSVREKFDISLQPEVNVI